MLSKSTEYAFRALVFVQLRNWEQKRPGVEEIAKEIEAPEAYTAKVLQTLTKNKLMDSMKGRGGGFFFNKNQSNLTLYEVICVMEGNTYFTKCGFGLKHCSNEKPCPLHEEYKVVREEFYKLVQRETIHSLAEKIRAGDAVLTDFAKFKTD